MQTAVPANVPGMLYVELCHWSNQGIALIVSEVTLKICSSSHIYANCVRLAGHCCVFTRFTYISQNIYLKKTKLHKQWLNQPRRIVVNLVRKCNKNWYFKYSKSKSAKPCPYLGHMPWWRHQMETFSVLLAIYAGNSLVTGEFTARRPVTRSFGVFFDLHLYKRLSKQS